MAILFCRYAELSTDVSVMTVVRAYQQRGSGNILVVDWANLGFGNYLAVALDLKPVCTLPILSACIYVYTRDDINSCRCLSMT